MGRTDAVDAGVHASKTLIKPPDFLIRDAEHRRGRCGRGRTTETSELRFLCDVERIRAGDCDDCRIAGFSRTKDRGGIRGDRCHDVGQRLTDDEDIITDLKFVIKQRAGACDSTTSTTRSDRRNRHGAGVGALFILVSPSRHIVSPSANSSGIYDADTAALLGAVAFVWASRAFVSTSRILAAINSVA